MPLTLDPSQIYQYYDQGYYTVKGALADADFVPIETAYADLIDQHARDF